VAPTAQPTSGASAEPGTRDVLFTDDMSDPTSGWSLLNEDFATISYDTGVLAFRFNSNPSWAFTGRKLTTPVTSLISAADFSPQSKGVFGILCGDSATNNLYGAVVNAEGGLIFVQIQNGTISTLERHDNLKLDVNIADSNPMAVECNADGAGALTMIAGLKNTGPVAAYHVDADAPTSLDAVGLYGEAESDAYTLAVDLATASGLGSVDQPMSDQAQILLRHIPIDFQKNCWESPQFSDAAQYIVSCVPQTGGKGAEIERYEQYADADSMNAAYQDLVTTFGVPPSGQKCDKGPNEADWQINEQTGGRVQCAPQKVGIRFDWTDDLTNILGSLIDFEGSYSDTYSQWQDAGPIIPQG
jgi:hypothetical protein